MSSLCASARVHAEVADALQLKLLLAYARIQYTSGEFEDLDLNEIIREGHMSLICQ